MKQLHTLDLSHNQLITSRGLHEAPSVQCLDLSNNHLQGVDDLENLAILQRLSASGNNLMQVRVKSVNVFFWVCQVKGLLIEVST